MVQLPHLHMTAGKTIDLTVWTFDSKVVSLLFNTLSRFVIAILPRGNHLLISWLPSLSSVILSPRRRALSLLLFAMSKGADAMILDFLLSFKPALSLSSFTFIKRFFSSSLLYAMSGVLCIYEVVYISPGNLDSSLCFIQPCVTWCTLHVSVYVHYFLVGII